jgi:hemicentin
VKNEQKNSLRLFLKIENATETDNGSFQCYMSNKLGHQSSSIDLLIQTPSKIDAILLDETEIGEQSRALEGSNLKFECVVDGFPLPQVYWTFNGEKISDEFELDIKIMSSNHEGVYECVAENILGQTSKKFNLSMNFSPKIKDSFDGKVEKFVENKRIELECDIFGSPSPQLNWMFNKKHISFGDKFDLKNNNKTLSFVAKIDDSGIFTCVGENEFGSAQKTFTIAIMCKLPIIFFKFIK